MLSKQHLANPGLRYQQRRRDQEEAPAQNVAPARNPNVAAMPNSSQDVWLNNVDSSNRSSAGGVALRPAYIDSSNHAARDPPPAPPAAAARPPSRINSRMSDDSDFYTSGDSASSAPAQPGAVRMPALDGQEDGDDDAGGMSYAVPPAVDPYHHVVAQAVDENADNELLKRVLDLEQDLKKSYQTMMASTHNAAMSTDGSGEDTDALRNRVKELEQQLESQTNHSRDISDSGEFADAGPDEGLVTAPSSRIVVATVDPSGELNTSVRSGSRRTSKDVELATAEEEEEEEEESKGMPKACKCLICLILLGGIGAAVFFLVPFGKDEGGDADPVNTPPGTPTESPNATSPTLAPTETPLPLCPLLNDLFQENTSYAPIGDKNHTFSIDCSVMDPVSAIQIDRVTCEPSCAFLLERSAYETFCVDDTFEFNVPDEYFETQLQVGHLGIAGNFSCADATKYVVPDPSEAPTMAPSMAASSNPTPEVLVPTESPSQSPSVGATPPPTPEPTPPPTPEPTAPPTPEPTPPPTEPATDRLDEALNLFFPGETVSENSAEYRAAEWVALNDSRNAAVNSVEFRERFTLANLYYATNGDSWNRRSGWTGGDNHCNWESVTCSNGQVSELDLRDNNIRGPMIRTWGNLALISRLRMSDNALTGTIPKEIGDMSNLGRLELSQNSLDGEFPTEIGRLVQLTNLQIRNNSFRGRLPTHLGRLNRLQSFVAEFNQFTGQIPNDLSGMTSLRNIYLGRNQLAGPIPASFGSFTQLTLLSISENRLSGALPAELGRMTNLQRFSAAQNRFSGSIPDDYGAWTAMTYLSVFDNQLTGTIPSSVSAWGNTDTIYFYETAVTGSMNSFCGSGNVGSSNFEFYAECGLECSCCTHCCTNQNCQSV